MRYRAFVRIWTMPEITVVHLDTDDPILASGWVERALTRSGPHHREVQVLDRQAGALVDWSMVATEVQ